MINQNAFKTGDILLGYNNHPRDGNHYIVYFKDINGYDFEGGMISTSHYRGVNRKMEETHFESVDTSSGGTWRVIYKNSHLVPARLFKFGSMGRFEKVGQLTEKGIEFLTANIAAEPLMPWEDYIRRQNLPPARRNST